MAKLCLCLTGRTIQENLDVIETYRGAADLAELRADMLDPDEQYYIRSFPERAGLPVILTIRRTVDGGLWADGEGARMVLLAKGLAYADSDPRKNFAYVDLEEDLKVQSVEEAARAFGTRIIRSRHDVRGTPDDCSAALAAIPHNPDEIPKLAVRARSVEDSIRILRAARSSSREDRIVLGMGDEGFWTRVVPDSLGSFLTYASAISGGKASAACGQADPRVLLGAYRFRSIGPSTRLYAVAGRFAMGSPLMASLNEALAERGEDAVFFPLPASSFAPFMEFAGLLGLAGAVILPPLRAEAAAACQWRDETSRRTGSASFVRMSPRGWLGYDPDSPCVTEALKAVVGRRLRFGRRGVVLGAGPAAEAAVGALRSMGYRVIASDRSLAFGRDGRAVGGVDWAGPEATALKVRPLGRVLIVKTARTALDLREDDPLPEYTFTGEESVIDIVSGGEVSAFARRASEAGCAVRDGTVFRRLQTERIVSLLASGEGARR